MPKPRKSEQNPEKKEGRKETKSSPGDVSSPDVGLRAYAFFKRAQKRMDEVDILRSTRDLTPPGFARLPEKPEIQSQLEHMSTLERFNLLKEVLKGKEMTKEQELRVEQVNLLRDFADVVAEMQRGQISTVQEIYAMPKQWISSNLDEFVAKAMTDENFSLEGFLPENLEKLMKDNGVPFDLVKTKEQLLERESLLVAMAREYGAYGVAEAVLDRTLADEFKQGNDLLDTTTKLQVNVDAAADIALSLNENVLKMWRSQGMTEAQIAEMRQQLIDAEYQKQLRREVAKRHMGTDIKFSGVKQKLWTQYEDMLNPKGKLYKMSDETWDYVKQEIIINAPLIVVSGGVAGLVRTGFEVAVRGAARASIRTAGAMLVEGAAFDVVHRVVGKKGEWYKDLPDFAQSVLWSSASLGLFHKASRVGERFFTKVITLPGGEQLKSLTYLGRQVEKINIKGNQAATNALRAAAKELMVKGHVEAVAMLVVGAIQNGCYTGNLDEFMHGLGDELLHAYVAVGALKTSGRIAGKMQKDLLPNWKVEEDRQEPKVRRNTQKEGRPDMEKIMEARANKNPVIQKLNLLSNCLQEFRDGQVSRLGDINRLLELLVAHNGPNIPQIADAHEGTIGLVKELYERSRKEVIRPDEIDRVVREVQDFVRDFRENFDRNESARLKDLLRDAKAAMPEVDAANIDKAVQDSMRIEGLPGTVESTEAYIIPGNSVGGMGVVRTIFYRNAKGKILKKMIKTALRNDPFRIAALEQEAFKMDVVADFGEHPNLMKVHRGKLRDSDGRTHLVIEPAGEFNGRPFISNTFLTPKARIGLLSQVMKGLKVIHDHGCIHRDLKWDNTMINQDGSLKIIDYGTLSAQPNPSSPQLQKLRADNVAEIHNGGVVTTWSIFEGSVLGQELYDGMKFWNDFLPQYDYIAVFQMAKDVVNEAITSGNLPTNSPLYRIREIAERGIRSSALGAVDVYYMELKKLVDRNS